MMSGLGGIRPSTGGGGPGLGGFSMPNLAGPTRTPRGDHNSSSARQIPIGPGRPVLSR